ncbi:MAG: SRPBCC family protein [Pseudomonadales bacterium]
MEFFEQAPACFTNSVDINASPERVFDAFEDADSWPQWAFPITKVTWTSPTPFRLGTTRTVEMRGGMTGYEEFIAWDRGKRMAFRFNEATMDSIAAFGEDYIVEETSAGCRLTWIMAMEPAGSSKFIVPLFGPIMKWNFGRMLRNFAKLVEKSY